MRISFPLEGIWEVVTSPADRVPSHYTTRYGMGYAVDFAKPEDTAISWRRRLFGKTRVEQTAGWGARVTSPVSGRIVTVHDDQQDRGRITLAADLWSMFRAATFQPADGGYGTVFGNYVIIEAGGCYCLLAHLMLGSICVREGQRVDVGDPLGRLEHSGSSFVPHLHLQVMDDGDLERALGLSFSLNDVLIMQDGGWVPYSGPAPKRGAKLRRMER